MKAAVAIKKGEHSVVIDPSLKVPLHEFVSKSNATILEGFVPDPVTFPTFDQVVESLANDSFNGIEVFSFTQEQEAPAEETPEVTRQEVDLNYVGITDEEKAQRIRARIRDILLNNGQVRVNHIFLVWGTNLSRVSISRHMAKVVQGLAAEGVEVKSRHGRYFLSQSDLPH